MSEFAELFGRHPVWAYRQWYAGKLKVIEGFGILTVPVSEVERLKASARFCK